MCVQTLLLIVGCSLAVLASKGPPVATRRRLQHISWLGDDVKLTCPLEGNPYPMTVWYKGEESINHQFDSRYKKNKKWLKIQNVNKGDSGLLVCKGINGFGKVQVEIDLIVVDRKDFPNIPEGQLPKMTQPEFTESTKQAKNSFEKSVDENFRVACSAVGKPEPVIKWYKNGHEQFNNVREKHGRSMLAIKHLKPSDSGKYTCVAQSKTGKVQKNFNLIVEEADLLDQPKFSLGLMNRTVAEGEMATFDCHVKSISPPHIKWLKKLDGIKPTDNMSQIVVVKDENYRLIHSTKNIDVRTKSDYHSQLVLSNAVHSDSGMYICFVTNPQGGFNFHQAFLIVNSRELTTAEESPLIIILVICLGLTAFFTVSFAIMCLVRRRRTPDKQQAEPGVTRPAGGVYATAAATQYADANQYEVPHQQQRRHREQQQHLLLQYGGKTPGTTVYGGGSVHKKKQYMPVYHYPNTGLNV